MLWWHNVLSMEARRSCIGRIRWRRRERGRRNRLFVNLWVLSAMVVVLAVHGGSSVRWRTEGAR